MTFRRGDKILIHGTVSEVYQTGTLLVHVGPSWRTVLVDQDKAIKVEDSFEPPEPDEIGILVRITRNEVGTLVSATPRGRYQYFQRIEVKSDSDPCRWIEIGGTTDFHAGTAGASRYSWIHIQKQGKVEIMRPVDE